MKRLHLSKVTTIVASMCLLVLSSAIDHTPATAATDNGYLIDDAIYYNTSSMTVGQIQDLINRFPKSCLLPSNYPGGLSWATFREPAGYFDYGSVDVSPAQIIWKASQLYSINPQVILATLEKEQALVSGNTVYGGCVPTAYNSAMGYNCPDGSENSLKDYPDLGVTKTCVAKESNVTFSRQVNHAAWQLSFDGKRANGNLAWMGDGATYYYGRMTAGIRARVAGGTESMYDGYTTIDGTTVFLKNGATAALYNYTPHFNSFATIFSNWFGSTTTSIPYAWQYVSQAAYLDAGYTQKINYGDVSVQPGQTIYIEIVAKNVGYKDWDANTHIGTSHSNDRSSIFANSSWLGAQRPAGIMNQLPVTPSNNGTFRFSITAPSSKKSFREYFSLVQDGAMWMNDPGLYFNFNVTSTATNRSTNRSTLGVNELLKAGQYLLSDDTNTALYMSPAGNLVLMNNMLAVWSSGTSGNPGSYAVLQSDGNFVVYSKNNQPLWSSGVLTTTQGNTLSLKLQSDANLVLLQSGIARWSTKTNTVQDQLSVVNTAIIQGGMMLPGQSIQTADRTRTLVLQSDGNLVLYNASGIPLWNTGTNGKSTAFAIMQTDGNLVIYDTSYRPLWSSQTDGRGMSYLRLQDDSNLVIYNLSARPTWATMTDGK